MKKLCFATMFLALSCVAFAQDLKKHSFGVGVGTITTSSTNQYLKFQDRGIQEPMIFGKIDNEFDLNLSLIYEYALNNKITLGFAPTYRLSKISLVTQPVSSSISTIGYGAGDDYTHDLDLPLYLDYRLLRLTEKSNFIVGGGFSGLINLSVSSDYLSRETFTPYLSLRTGLEINAKHRMQVMLKYRWSISEGAYLEDHRYLGLGDNTKNFRINTFDVSFNLFF